MLRALLLIMFAFVAMFSNISHAAAGVTPPAVSHYQSHHNDKPSLPCCEAGVCVGCAVVPAAFVAPTHIKPRPFEGQPSARLIAFAGRDAHPDLPPPRF
jgi:hypothetical protein